MNNMPYKGTMSEMFPDEWDIVPLGDVFNPITIRLKDVKGSAKNIPILSMTRANGLVLQSEKFDKRVASRDTSNYKIVKKGQLVYGFPIDEGVIAILHRYPIGAVSPAYNVWEPIMDVDLTFVDYMLKTPFMINAYKMFSSNVVERRRNLAQRDFIQIPIPLPPLPEQHAIAHVLNTVRQAIETTERVIAAARELKRSMMKYLFTYGPVPVHEADQVSLKETEIGEVPEDWEDVKIDDLGEIITGRTPSTNNSDYYGGPYKLISPANLGERQYVETAHRWLTEKGLDSAKELPTDTVLVSCIGYVGKTGLTSDNRSATNQQINAIVCKSDINPKFIYYLMTYLQKHLENRARVTTVPILNKTNFGQINISIPSFLTQNTLAHYLDSNSKKIEIELKKKFALEALFNSLLNNLMTGKVRVSTLIPSPSPSQGEGSQSLSPVGRG